MSEPAAIFLAEDSPADVYLFREALKAHGVDNELFVFGDGEAAMSFLTTAEQTGPIPQLFVLDLNLPKIDGRTILKFLRDSHRFAHSLVVILTSSSNVADREESIQSGADCYIQKAQNINEFLDIGRRIKEMLRKS